MDRKEIVQLTGTYTWSFGVDFFIETARGNFVWSDPDYGGDNSIKPFEGSYEDWCSSVGIPFGRDKGQHVIADYIGETEQHA